MNARTLIDAGARQRIREDVEVSMCVEAGAGTGKTTTLVDRIVEVVRRGRATVDELAVITFTEKAAAELSTRVRFALEEAVNTAAAQERERLEVALGGLYRARVQTIHAFASDLLRERPVEARLDPRFELLDDLGGALRFDDAYQRWLDALLAESREEVELAVRRGFELRHLRELAEALHRHRHVLPLQPWALPTPDLDGYRRWAGEAVRTLDRCAPSCTDESDGAFVHMAEVRAYLAQVERTQDDGELERLVLFEAPSPGRGGNKANWRPGEDCTTVKDLYGELRDRTPGLQNALRCEALCAVLPHAERFVADYAEQRRREGIADFTDLLVWARDLVRDQPTVREHFHRRTTHVLVDEFQDTDPIQAELIAWLCAPPGARGDWRQIVPEPGSLFVVGDPKQSIYRFRGADIAAYDAVKSGPLAARLERLEQNFRSTHSVLRWVNGVFDRVFQANPGVQPANTHLHAVPTALDDALDRSSIVVVHSDGTFAGDEPKPSAEMLRTEESKLLARTIARAVRDEAWPVRDPHDGDRVRTASWRDVAILVPSRTRLELLEAALQRHEVPYRLEGGRGYFARQEVRDTISLLEAIDDPTDSIAIVGALRSLAFGCSDEELLHWRLAHDRFDYRGPDDGGPACVREAMEVLLDLHRAQRGLSLAQLVRETVERTGLVEAALTLPGGEQAAANILKVVESAQAFATSGGGALRAFTGWLERMRDEEHDDADAPVAEERDDVVRVLTIHAAKGLEFPIVALGNLEGEGPKQIPPVPEPGAHRLHLSLGNKDYGRFMTPGWEDQVKPREVEALAAERERLLYVATTRARDHLIVPVCTTPSTAKGFMAKLQPSLAQPDHQRTGQDVDGCWLYDTAQLDAVAEVAVEVLAIDADAPVDEAAARAREHWRVMRDETVRAAAHGIELVTASSVRSAQRPLAAQSDTSERPGDADRPPAIDTEGAPPLELGDAFHRVMELVDLPDAENLEALAEALCLEAGIPQSAGVVVDMARLTLRALAEVMAGRRVLREVPFVVPDGDRVLVGRIDLVVDGDGEPPHVVDFKTDARRGGSAAAAAAHHAGQVETYRTAVRSTLDGRAVRLSIVFARTGELAELARPS